MTNENPTAAVIVAHPDDETLWAGGTILMNPSWTWFIAALCRGSDTDRSPKFRSVLDVLRADGKIADMDDAPQQTALDEAHVRETILTLLPEKHFDVVITHSPHGEYTRHRRHEETARAVISLWRDGKISTGELRLLAYDDDNAEKIPLPIKQAHMHCTLPENIRQEKYRIITEIYGFPENGFEARAAAGTEEAFWRFTQPQAAWDWMMNNKGGREK